MSTKAKKAAAPTKAKAAPAKAAKSAKAEPKKSAKQLKQEALESEADAILAKAAGDDEGEGEEEEEAAAAGSSAGGNAAALAAATSTSSEMSASFKNFRHHPDMENFYRFIYENDLRLEALSIINTMMTERAARKAVRSAKANAH